MKNILITGGAGFIGSNLALKLLDQGYNVTVLDNLSAQVHGDYPEKTSPLYQSILGKVTFIIGDVTCEEDVAKSIKGQDAIIHLAAETGTGQSMYCVKKYAATNIVGTANILHEIINKKNNIQKVVLASSRAVYGEGKYQHESGEILYPQARNPENLKNSFFEIKHCDGSTLTPMPTDEEAVTSPNSIYGISKLSQEQMLMLGCSSVGVAAVALRFQNVYGKGQSLQNPYTGIISIFSNQILSGKPLNIFEDGGQMRDFIYIDDAIRAICLSLQQNISSKVINVGSGIGTPVLKVAQDLIKILNPMATLAVSRQYRIGDIRHNFADTTKAEKILDFKTQITLTQGLSRFCEWVKTQEIIENGVEKSLEEMRLRKMLF